MTRYTSKEFYRFIENDPAWASKLTEPTEISGFVEQSGSKITHLSPLLHFLGGLNKNVASFTGSALKAAEGTFHGHVSFDESDIETTKGLIVLNKNNLEEAASFRGCNHLKVAEGSFAGAVSYEDSAIEKIGDLKIKHINTFNYSANFHYCRNLKVAEGIFPGRVDFSNSGVHKIGNLVVTNPDQAGTLVDFRGCDELTLPKEWFHKAGVILDVDGSRRAEITIQKELEAKRLLKSQADLEI